ncbi:MAG: hypothetical protein N3D84_02430, partial [Candidatus Woesearchaeota archaeon]|nr:hypothetical protein [Candidatus Woesearchaeota archaeon]
MIPNSGGLSRKIGFKETIRHMFLDIESMLSVLATDTIPSIENSIKDKIHNKFEPNMKLLYY